MFSKVALATTLLAAASQVRAQLGNSIVKNQCSGNVYLSFVTNTPGELQTIPPGGSYTNSYQTNPDGGGISIKLSTEANGPITQFEYTLGTGQWADLFYDISNINGYPFLDGGLSLIPSDPSCRSVICPSGVVCTLAYNQPDDNEATASCGTSSDMTLVLCSEGGSGGSDGNQVDAPSSTSAPPPPPSSTSTYVPPPPSSTSTYVPPPPPTSTSTYVPPPPPTSTSTYVPPPPSSTSTSTYVPSTSTSTYVPPPPTSTAEPTSTSAYVATTFTTHVTTVTAAPIDDGADWSFFHHPASLGAFWSPNKREQAEAQREVEQVHKRAAHRHHFNRHAAHEDAN